jgi:hypothetical protein
MDQRPHLAADTPAVSVFAAADLARTATKSTGCGASA